MHCAVEHQVTGPGETNAYLLYDAESGEAALVDVGGPIDSLISIIEARGLSLKYIFTTHAHVNHVWGVPSVRERFPEAKWCASREEFEDTCKYARWDDELPPEEAAEMRAMADQDEEFAAFMAFTFDQLGEPDVFVEDGQVYLLGDLPIRTFLAPGHSRGSICLYVGDALFSGDVLLYRTAGREDLAKSLGPEKLRASILRLYSLLPDDTTVYTGHGPATQLGLEKLHNWVVRV